MQRFPRRWDTLTCINYLQRKIILNSIAYYEFDKSFLSDKYFDSISHQLVEMQKNYKGNIEVDTEYGYMMFDFDGSTGFDLPGKLNLVDREYLYQMTQHFLNKKKEVKKAEKPSNVKKRRLF